MYLSDLEAKNLICEIGRKMYMKQMVAANDGNMTIRVSDNTVIATPTGVSKGDLTPDMLVKVDFDGNILEGSLKPTSEIYMHLNIYKHNSEIMSTCHAHPVFSSAFAIAGIEADLSTTPAAIMITGRMKVAPYECPGSMELADSVIPYVKDYNMVLLANHGPITWGKDPIGAWFTMEEAENYCKVCILLKYIMKEIRPISNDQIETLQTKIFRINENRKMTAPESTQNREMPKSLSSIETENVILSEKSLNQLAELIAYKIKALEYVRN